MKRVIQFFSLIFPIVLVAQNLVPNPSFEYIDESTLSQWGIVLGANGLIESAVPWFSPKESSECTSDLNDALNYNLGPEDCSTIVRNGTKAARVGVLNDYSIIYNTSPDFDAPREYIEVKLNEILLEGQKYIVSIHVLLPICSPMHNGIGAYFSEDSLLYSNVDFLQTPWDMSLCPITPQVQLKPNQLMPTNDWYHFQESFTAQGGEQFMTIGNFRSDEEVNFITDSVDCFGCDIGGYYWFLTDLLYLDDIAVFAEGTFQDSARLGNDTTLCFGESLTLGTHNYPAYTYTYTDENGNEYPGAYLELTPNQSSTYILTVRDDFYIDSHDTITFYVDDCIEYTASAGNDTTICIGESLVLQDVYYANYQYQWSNNLGDLWDGYSVEIYPTESSYYYLQVTDDIDITYDSLFITVLTCDASLSKFNAANIKLNPNPASNRVQIDSPYAVNSWSLRNSIGSKVLSSENKNEKAFTLDISKLETGLYFLELNIEGLSIVKRFVKE